MSSLAEGVVVSPKKAIDKGPGYHYVQKTIGNDTWLVMAQSQIELEDEWSSLYYTAANQSNIFLMPPFEPEVLLKLSLTNNVLNQCIEAMEVNCDSTGHDFDPIDKDTQADPDEELIARAFFNEPYPNVSMIPIRRKLRRYMEAIGYGYLEVLRNMAGEVVGLRNVETHNVRMVKLDEPVLVKKTINRDGKDVELQMWVRERRFAQRVALKTLVYYKEFGATRDVDRNNGRWATDAFPVEVQNRGTELLIFGIDPDLKTPYFLPRWINQMPSVVGSRKAEEQNLEFLDSGGMPPAIVFIQGGTLAKDTSDQLRMYLSGHNKNKYRAVVVEAQSSSGSLDAAGNVQVKVERFGAERAQDAMFMKYDENTEEHVRSGFRLAPIFLGKPNDYNFATAQTAYLVTEEQVFAPERNAFDEVINMTIMKALGLKTIKFRSKPITLKDNTGQLAALTLAKDLATRESMLEEINEITGMALALAPEPQPDSVSGSFQQVDPVTGQVTNVQQLNSGRQVAGKPQTPQQPPAPTAQPTRGGVQKPEFQSAKPVAALPPQPAGGKMPPKPNAVKPGPKKPKTAMELVELAQEYVQAHGLTYKSEASPDRADALKAEIEDLSWDDQKALNSLVATYTYGSDDPSLALITRKVQ